MSIRKDMGGIVTIENKKYQKLYPNGYREPKKWGMTPKNKEGANLVRKKV